MGMYKCNSCPWTSSKESRPLLEGEAVLCPVCRSKAPFQGLTEEPTDETLDDVAKLNFLLHIAAHGEPRNKVTCRLLFDWDDTRAQAAIDKAVKLGYVVVGPDDLTYFEVNNVIDLGEE